MDAIIGFLDRLISNPAFWGFLGVIVGGAITWWRESRKDGRDRKRALAYASALVSSEIYEFVSLCSDVAGDSGRPDNQGIFHTSTIQPDLSFVDLEIDWRSLPPSLADRVLSLPNNLRDVKRKLADIGEHTDPGDEKSYIFERQLAYAELGVIAEDLRKDVRAAAKLEVAAPSSSARFLYKQRRRLAAERAAIDALLTKQQASMPIPPPPAAQA